MSISVSAETGHWALARGCMESLVGSGGINATTT